MERMLITSPLARRRPSTVRLLGTALTLLSIACCAERRAVAPSATPAAAPEPTPPPGFRPLIDGEGLVTIDTDRGPTAFRVEVVTRPESRAQGLMFRRSLPADGGMLFVFEDEDVQSFWMRNTLIPLDMLFITQAGRVVGIVENAAPLTESPRTVGLPSRYVLELRGGAARLAGIRAGATARLDWRPY